MQCKEYLEVIPLHCHATEYPNTFCGKANDLKSQNIPDTPNLWLANKIFHNYLCVYAFMYYHISSMFYHICFTSYCWFIHLLYIFCMMNVVST